MLTILNFTETKMDPHVSDLCWHGSEERRSLIRMIWPCTEVRQSWEGKSKYVTFNIKCGCITIPRSVRSLSGLSEICSNTLDNVSNFLL